MDLSLLRIFFFVVIIPSAIFHEYMHGWVADRLGDPTARYAGRLTLNPLAHVDPWGTVLMPLILFLFTGGRFMFAYAKPVPYNPYNLRDQRRGPMWVALAGPLSNFLLAFVFGLLTRAVAQLSPESLLPFFLSMVVYANVVLGIFNLVPIPPLDGSKVLFALLPAGAGQLRAMLEQYGFMILLVFMIYFFSILTPLIEFFYRLFVGSTVLL